MNKIKIFGLVLCSLFLVSVSKAQQATEINASEEKVTVYTETSIEESEIISQENNKLGIFFKITNRKGAQSDLKYGVHLVKEADGSQEIVDEKIFSEVTNIEENKKIPKKIEYIAPEYLSGNFQVWVVLKNSSGLTFGLSAVGDVVLNGNGEFIEIKGDTCSLKVGNENYSLQQGVDIEKNEDLLIQCQVVNNFKRKITVVPRFETFHRSTFGQPIETNNLEVKTMFKPGEEKQISFSVPKQSKPQSYDVKLSLLEKNEKVSESLIFHYVLRGQSGTIQNLQIDKDYYKKGEIAKLDILWTGSADSFSGSRLGDSGNDEKFILSVDFKNQKGELCAGSVTQQLNKKSPSADLKVPITNDCLNPWVKAILKDSKGNILDEKEIKITSQVIAEEESSNILSVKNTGMILITIAVLFLLLLVIIKLVKSNKQNKLGIFLFLAMAGVFFLGGQEVEAAGSGATTNYCLNDDCSLFDVLAVYGHIGSRYGVGDTITAITNGTMNIVCGNSIDVYVKLEIYKEDQLYLIEAPYRDFGKIYEFHKPVSGERNRQIYGDKSFNIGEAGKYKAHFVVHYYHHSDRTNLVGWNPRLIVPFEVVPSSTFYEVSGRVTDDNGKGVEDVKVFFCGKNGSTFTNKDGEYSKKLTERGYCSRITSKGNTTINATNARCEGHSAYEYQMADDNMQKGCKGYEEFEKWDLDSDENLDFVISIAEPKKTIFGKLIADPDVVTIGESSLLTAIREEESTASGAITYQFKCKSSDDFGAIQKESIYSCTYNTPGNKTAKVIMTQEGSKTEPIATITVSDCAPEYHCNMPSGEEKCDESNCGEIVEIIGQCVETKCGGGAVDRETYCKNASPPKCEKDIKCDPCRAKSSNWIETKIYE